MARRTFKDYYNSNTPAGTFVYPHLQEPSTKFNPHGDYQVSLDLTGQAAEDLKKEILEAYENEYMHECQAKGTKLKRYDGMPFGPALDADKNEIPGVTRFKFKRKAGGIYGPNHPKAGQTWTSHFPIFGAAGTKQVSEPIWGGTIGRIAFSVVPWYTNSLGFGCRLNIEAVKVITLVSQGERAPSAYGFEDEEGYVPAEENSGTSELAAEEESGCDF